MDKYILPQTTSKAKAGYDFVFKGAMMLAQALVVSSVLYTAWKTHEIGCEMGIYSNFPCFTTTDDIELDEVEPETILTNMTDAVNATIVNATIVNATNGTIN